MFVLIYCKVKMIFACAYDDGFGDMTQWHVKANNVCYTKVVVRGQTQQAGLDSWRDASVDFV